MCSNAGVQPASVVLIAYKGFMLDHLGGVVHSGPDLPSNLGLPEGNHHSPDGRLSRLPSRKQMPKLQQARCLLTCCQILQCL